MSVRGYRSDLLKIFGGIALSAAIGAAASPALAFDRPEGALTLVRDRISGVGEICRSAMRLSPGTSDYGACTDSLSDSLRQIGAAQGIERARQTCLDRGVRAGGSDLALCMVEAMRATNPAAPAPNASFASYVGGKSYSYMSSKDRRHAEQLSCAALGLEPGSTGFSGCVTSLDASLFNADNPAH